MSQDAVQGAQDIGSVYAVVVGIVHIPFLYFAQEASKTDLAERVPVRWNSG